MRLFHGIVVVDTGKVPTTSTLVTYLCTPTLTRCVAPLPPRRCYRYAISPRALFGATMTNINMYCTTENSLLMCGIPCKHLSPIEPT